MSTRTVLIGLALAIVCSLASVGYQQIGPIEGFVGTECGDPQHKCVAPVLNGGFPVPYLIDVPTIAVPDQLNADDDFRVWAFVADVAFYWVVFLLTGYLLARRAKGKTTERL